MELEELSEGEFVLWHGELGDKYYIVLKGSVWVLVPTEQVMKCKRSELL